MEPAEVYSPIILCNFTVLHHLEWKWSKMQPKRSIETSFAGLFVFSRSLKMSAKFLPVTFQEVQNKPIKAEARCIYNTIIWSKKKSTIIINREQIGVLRYWIGIIFCIFFYFSFSYLFWHLILLVQYFLRQFLLACSVILNCTSREPYFI